MQRRENMYHKRYGSLSSILDIKDIDLEEVAKSFEKKRKITQTNCFGADDEIEDEKGNTGSVLNGIAIKFTLSNGNTFEERIPFEYLITNGEPLHFGTMQGTEIKSIEVRPLLSAEAQGKNLWKPKMKRERLY